MLATFARGLFLKEHKDAIDAPLAVAPIPQLAIIPLQQHIGAPCKPLVKPGGTVKRFERIGESEASVVHSSVSGTVAAIELRPSPNGAEVLSVVITVSGDSEEKLKPLGASRPTRDQILKRVQEAGIVGMGGAGFPTHLKLKAKVDTLLVNCAECEPYLTCDHLLMREHPDEIIRGIVLEMRCLGAKRAVIAVEENKADAAQLFTRRLEGAKLHITVMLVKTKYPQGAEKLLMKAALGRVCKHTSLPSEVGVVVSNVATVKAVHDAVVLGKPLVERMVTVSGNVGTPMNILARIGTPVQSLLALADVKGYDKLIIGGPMTGVAQYTADVPVIKTTSAVLALTSVEEKTLHCVRCGKCIEACPYGLMPAAIAKASLNGQFGLAEKLYAKECMECGCCAYVCPSRIPLVQRIRVAKRHL